MPRQVRKCSVTGDVYENDRQHGYGCPHHTDLKRNGGKCTESQLVSYYPDRRREFPHGRYVCSFCRVHQELITLPDSPRGASSSTGSNSSATKEKPGCIATCGTIAVLGFLFLLCTGMLKGCS